MSAEAFNLRGRVDVDERDAKQKLESLEKQAGQTFLALQKLSGGRTQNRIKSEASMTRQLERLDRDLGNSRLQIEKRVSRETQQIRKATSVAEVREAGRLAAAGAQEKTKIARAQLSESGKMARAAAQLQSRENVAAFKTSETAQRQISRDLARDAARLNLESQRERERQNRVSSQQIGRVELESLKQRGRAERDAAKDRVRLERETQRQIESAQREGERTQRAAMARLDRAAKAGAREREREAKQATRLAQQSARATDGQRKKRANARSQLASDAGDGASLAGAGALAGLGAAATQAVDFDRSLRNINSIAQLSEKQLGKVSDALIKIADDPKIRQGPKDLADALYDVYSTGFQGKKALDILRASAIGAAAGLTDTKTSAGVLMSVLQSGVKGIKSPAEALNVLFQTVNDGRVTFEELSGSLGAVLPTASKAGVSLQELGAYLTVATKQGQSASEATTDLLNLLMKLVNPPKEAAKAFDALGIKTGYAALQNRGLSGTLDEIQRKTGGNADAIKKLLPDMQAQRAVLTALSKGGKDYAAALDSSKKANQGAGAAAKAAAKQNQGAAYELDIFVKQLKILAILTGQTVIPALNTLLRSTKPLFDAFRSMSPETRENTVKFVAFGAALLLVGGRIKTVIEIYTVLRTATMAIRGVSVAATVATNAQAVATGRLGVGLGVLRGRMIASTVATAAQTSGFWTLRIAGLSAFTALGVAAAALAVTYWGIKTAIIGTRDAGTMSADALIKKWGVLGSVWVKGGDALARVLNFLNRAELTAGDKAEKQSAAISKRLSAPGIQRAPKSDAWYQAHGYNLKSQAWVDAHPGYNRAGIKIDGARAKGGPVEGGKTYLVGEKGPELFVAKSAGTIIPNGAAGLQSRIDSLNNKADTRALSNARAGNARRDPQLKIWRAEATQLRRQLAINKREGAESNRTFKAQLKQQKAELKSQLKQQKAELKAAAKDYEQAAKVVQDSTEKTLSRIAEVRDGFKGLFSDAQSELISLGVTNNPLGGMIADVSRLLNLSGQARSAASNGRGQIQTLSTAGQKQQARADALANRADSSTLASPSGQMPAYLRAMEGAAGKNIGLQCGESITAYFRKSGIKATATNIARSGNARQNADGTYAPGTVFNFKGGKGGYRVNHYAMVGADGKHWTESNWAAKNTVSKNRPINWKRDIAAATWGGRKNIGQARGVAVNGSGEGFSPQSASVSPSQNQSRANLGAIDEVLWGGAKFDLSNARKMGRGWGKSILPGSGRDHAFGLQSKIASGEFDSQIRALGAALKAAKGGTSGVGPVANGGAYGSLLNLSKKGINLHWGKGWTQKDQALDFLKQLMDAEDKATGAAKRSDEARQKSKESLAEQIKGIKDARAAIAFGSAEQSAELAQIEAQRRYLLANPGDEPGWERQQSSDDFKNGIEKNESVRALRRGGRTTEADVFATQLSVGFDKLQRAKDGLEALRKEQEEFAETSKDIAESMAALPSISEFFADSQKTLQEALSNTSSDASELQSALDALPETVKNVIAAGGAVEALGAKHAAFFGTLKKVQGELEQKRAYETAAPQREITAEWQTQKLGLQKQLETGRRGWKRSLSAVQSQDLDWSYQDAVEKAQSPDKKHSKGEFEATERGRKEVRSLTEEWEAFEKKREVITRATEGVTNAFMDSFDAVLSRQQSFGEAFLQGLQSMLVDAARQVIQSQLQQALMGLFMGSIGGSAKTAPVTGSGSVNLRSGDNLASGFSLGVHASGLDKVPRDNYLMLAHRGEKIMAAGEAESWRQQQKAKEVAIVGNTATARRGAAPEYDEAPRGSGGSSGDVHIHLHGATNVNAGTRSDLATELMGQRLPRRELQRRVQRGMMG